MDGQNQTEVNVSMGILVDAASKSESSSLSSHFGSAEVAVKSKRKRAMIDPGRTGEATSESTGTGRATTIQRIVAKGSRVLVSMPTCMGQGLTTKRLRIANAQEIQAMGADTSGFGIGITGNPASGRVQGQSQYVMVNQGNQGQKIYRLVHKVKPAHGGALTPDNPPPLNELAITKTKSFRSKEKKVDSPNTRTSKIVAGLHKYLQQSQSRPKLANVSDHEYSKTKVKMQNDFGLQSDKKAASLFTRQKSEEKIQTTPTVAECSPPPMLSLMIMNEHAIYSPVSVEDARQCLEGAIMKGNPLPEVLDGLKSSLQMYEGKTPNCYGTDTDISSHETVADDVLKVKGKDIHSLLPDILKKEIQSLYASSRGEFQISVKQYVTCERDGDGSFELEFKFFKAAWKWVPKLRIGVTKEYPAEVPLILGIGSQANNSSPTSFEYLIGSGLRDAIRHLPDHLLRVPALILKWYEVVCSIQRKEKKTKEKKAEEPSLF